MPYSNEDALQAPTFITDGQTDSPPVRAREAMLSNGSVVAGRYRIISEIGRGGMGSVYRCRQIFLDKELALKILDSKKLSDVSVRRFQQEAKAIFGIEHPNLIAVHDFGLVDDKTPFLTMDLINGRSLAQLLADSGPLSVEDAARIFIRASFGLAFAHELGVIHRDIKPSNIMLVEGLPLTDERCIKIVDFGIAKFTQAEGFDVQTLTKTGEIFGSPLYMSPEQCLGLPVDKRSDIYSLGCVLFEVLTGTPPFLGASALSTMMHHAHQKAPSLKEAALGAEFPEAMEEIVARMLAKRQCDRYENLAQVIQDLSHFANANSSVQLLHENSANRQDRKAGLRQHEARKVTLSLTHLLLLIAAPMLLTALGCAVLLPGFINHDSLGKQKLNAESSVGKPAFEKTSGQDFQHIPAIDLTSHLSILDSPRQVHHLAKPIPASELREILAQKNPQAKLNLKYFQLDTECLKQIGASKWPENLDAGGANIKNPALSYLGNLNLYHATFSYSNFNDNGAAAVAGWNNLNSLELANTPVSDVGVDHLSKIKHLFQLDLECTDITGSAVRSLSACKSLLWLSLRGVKGIKDADLKPLAKSGLMFLNLENTEIGDEAAATISSMPRLRTICLGCTNISAVGLDKLSSCKALRNLYCVDCPHLPDKALKRLRQKCPNLKIVAKLHSGDLID